MNYEVFENLNFDNVKNLYNLCLENENNLNSVKTIYSRNNRHLQETLNFIIDINIIKIIDNKILINDPNLKLDNLILNKISKNPNYSFLVKNYLRNFTEDDNGVRRFLPNQGYNILTSSLRNFLISMNVLKYELDKISYYMDNNILDDYFKTVEFSPTQLKHQLDRQIQIGLEAELLVLKKEKEKLKSINFDLTPDHISLRDVSAGFDIKTYKKINGKIEDIFIEVKAVSSSNYKFHLSVGEYQTAIKFRDKYYLYLLPVDYSEQDRFNYEKILKINDIEKNIINNKIYWNQQNDGFIINKIV